MSLMRLRHANRLASLFPGVRSSEYHVAPPMMHAWRPGENPDNTHKMRFTRSFEAIPDPNKAQKYLPALLFTSRSHFSSQSASSATSSLLARMHDPSIAARVAVVNADSSHATYSDLCKKSERLSLLLKPHLKRGDTLASFCSGSADYVVAMMAAWSLDCRYLPLSKLSSPEEISYFLSDTAAVWVVGNAPVAEARTRLPPHVHYVYTTGDRIEIDHPSKSQSVVATSHEVKEGNADDGGALVIYTSGTTGRPKGVLHTHSSLEHMITGLAKSWAYSREDYILHFLPLHHLHGILNKLLCMLWVGGTVEFLPSANAEVIWKRITHTNKKDPTLLMAVPTVYAKLLEYSNKVAETERNAFKKATERMRLHVSGSAALPDPVMHAWERLSGQVLLERYGMTEAGMILSNPLSGPRLPGHVGFPLPFVSCRLVTEDNRIISHDSSVSLDEASIPHRAETSDSEAGELQIAGPTLFSKYLNLPKATLEAFVDDIWFCTGDIAVRTASGSFRILGRKSSDIIKSKGFKLSSLEIERALLSHPWIKEAAVVGLPDDIEGEAVVALLVVKSASDILAEKKINVSIETAYWTDEKLLHSLADGKALREFFVEHIRAKFLFDHLAGYKHPKLFHFVDSLPRNQLGKVNKKTVLKDCGIIKK